MHKARRATHPLLFLVLLLAFGLLGCGGPGRSTLSTAPGQRTKQPQLEGLPQPGALDALRGVSSNQETVDVTTPLSSASTLLVGANLGFTPPDGHFAYALYRIQPPVNDVVSLTAAGTDGLWIFVADYADQRWELGTQFAGGFAALNFDSSIQPLSPAGYVYCVVVAPSGVQGQLSSLSLTYNGPAHIYYVAPPADGGSDSNDGSSAAPWVSLQHAADTVGPDTLVIVRPGTYFNFTLASSGEADKPIEFKGEPGAIIQQVDSGENYGILLEGANAIQHIVIDGFTVSGFNAIGICVYGTGDTSRNNDIVIRNNSCEQNDLDGISVQSCTAAVVEGNNVSGVTIGDALVLGYDTDGAIVRNNTVHDNSISGIVFYNGTEPGGDNLLSNELIEGNTCYNNGLGLGAGIYCDGVTGATIQNNLVYNNGAGIGLTALNGFPSTGNTIANNTVVQPNSQGGCVQIQNLCTGNKVFNNILMSDVGAIEIKSDALTDFLSDYNICSDAFVLDATPKTLAQWQSALVRDQHSGLALPAQLFFDPGNNDYHLRFGCSAIDFALADYAPATDLDGNARPNGAASDAGCYEYTPGFPG